jgi:hypothetical protein
MTRVRRISIVTSDHLPLDQRIIDVCDIEFAAGYLLCSMVEITGSLILVFQKPKT